MARLHTAIKDAAAILRVLVFGLIIKGIVLQIPIETAVESVVEYNAGIAAGIAAARATQRLGEILIAHGKLDAANLDRALKVQESALSAADAHEKLGSILTRMGMLSGRDLAEALAYQRGWVIVEASEFPELPILEETVSPRFLQEARAIPVTESESEVVLAMTDPADAFTLQALAAATQKSIVPKLLSPTDFDTVYEKLYGSGKSSMGQIVDNIATRDDEQDFGDIEQLKDLASEAPVIRLVNLIINHALATWRSPYPRKPLLK